MIDYWKLIEDKGETLLCEFSIRCEKEKITLYYNDYYKIYRTKEDVVFVQIPPGKSNKSLGFTDPYKETWENKVRMSVIQIQKIGHTFHVCETYAISNRGYGYIISWINTEVGHRYTHLFTPDSTTYPIGLIP